MIAKPLLDATVVEDGESDRGFPNSTAANESHRAEILRKIDDSFDELVTPKTSPRRRGRRFPRYTTCELLDSESLVNQDRLTCFESGRSISIYSTMLGNLCVTYCTNLVVIILLTF